MLKPFRSRLDPEALKAVEKDSDSSSKASRNMQNGQIPLLQKLIAAARAERLSSIFMGQRPSGCNRDVAKSMNLLVDLCRI